MRWFLRHNSADERRKQEVSDQDMIDLRERSERLERDEQEQIREARKNAIRYRNANEINGWNEMMDGIARSLALSGRGHRR